MRLAAPPPRAKDKNVRKGTFYPKKRGQRKTKLTTFAIYIQGDIHHGLWQR